MVSQVLILTPPPPPFSFPFAAEKAQGKKNIPEGTSFVLVMKIPAGPGRGILFLSARPLFLPRSH